ncbi:MAG: Holliday junction resolvase RuvX, partial [Pyrinomonadaceae bacterium]
IIRYQLSILIVQNKQTANLAEISDFNLLPDAGRIIALDLGTKRIGVAVCDERQIVTRPLENISRRSWKELLKTVSALITEFDAIALVLGLPYNFDGSESAMSGEARRLHRNFSLSFAVPVFLQDERATSFEARGKLWKQGANFKETRRRVDGEAAAIILEDFLALKADFEKGRKGEREKRRL